MGVQSLKCSCFSAPLPENTASSVSIDLENSGNSYAKAVKQTTQTHPSFKPPLIEANESKQPGQDLASLNTKTLSSYFKPIVKSQLNLQKLPVPNKPHP